MKLDRGVVVEYVGDDGTKVVADVVNITAEGDEVLIQWPVGNGVDAARVVKPAQLREPTPVQVAEHYKRRGISPQAAGPVLNLGNLGGLLNPEIMQAIRPFLARLGGLLGPPSASNLFFHLATRGCAQAISEMDGVTSDVEGRIASVVSGARVAADLITKTLDVMNLESQMKPKP